MRSLYCRVSGTLTHLEANVLEDLQRVRVVSHCRRDLIPLERPPAGVPMSNTARTTASIGSYVNGIPG